MAKRKKITTKPVIEEDEDIMVEEDIESSKIDEKKEELEKAEEELNKSEEHERFDGSDDEEDEPYF